MFDMMNSQYFKSLPDDIREHVMESGVIFNTEDDLRKFINGLKG